MDLRLLMHFVSVHIGGVVRAEDFSEQIDLSPLATVAVQHNQTMKTLDTFARQGVWEITGHEKLDGESSVYTLLDMSFHPDEYVTRNIIKIVNVPLREEFENLQSIDDGEKQRIVKEGTVSLAFMERPEVQEMLAQVQAASVFEEQGDQSGDGGGDDDGGDLPGGAGVYSGGDYSAGDGGGDGLWHRPVEMIGDVPELVEVLKRAWERQRRRRRMGMEISSRSWRIFSRPRGG